MLRVECQTGRAVGSRDCGEMALRRLRLELRALAPFDRSQLRQIAPHIGGLSRKRIDPVAFAEGEPACPIRHVRPPRVFCDGVLVEIVGEAVELGGPHAQGRPGLSSPWGAYRSAGEKTLPWTRLAGTKSLLFCVGSFFPPGMQCGTLGVLKRTNRASTFGFAGWLPTFPSVWDKGCLSESHGKSEPTLPFSHNSTQRPVRQGRIYGRCAVRTTREPISTDGVPLEPHTVAFSNHQGMLPDSYWVATRKPRDEGVPPVAQFSKIVKNYSPCSRINRLFPIATW